MRILFLSPILSPIWKHPRLPPSPCPNYRVPTSGLITHLPSCSYPIYSPKVLLSLHQRTTTWDLNAVFSISAGICSCSDIKKNTPKNNGICKLEAPPTPRNGPRLPYASFGMASLIQLSSRQLSARIPNTLHISEHTYVRKTPYFSRMCLKPFHNFDSFSVSLKSQRPS